jgi:hypothetical protein
MVFHLTAFTEVRLCLARDPIGEFAKHSLEAMLLLHMDVGGSNLASLVGSLAILFLVFKGMHLLGIL